MGKGPGRANRGRASRGGRQRPEARQQLNPFDTVANKKQKFEVLNKRTKGAVRNLARARGDAIERRKKTLLADYQASRKDNTFKDRRFGESDPSLSLEDKMMMRFQMERQRRARKSSAALFSLEDDDDAQGELLLTHKGRALNEDDYKGDDADAVSSDDDEGQLGREIVKSMHFGGGVKRSRDGGGDGDNGREKKKSRAEVMEEIIAKSKMHKVGKAKARGYQQQSLEALDDQFQDILTDLDFRTKIGGGPQPKPKVQLPKTTTIDQSKVAAADSKKKERPVGDKGGVLGRGGEEDYEELLLTLKEEGFAAKAKDRIKTDEEIAKEEKERLEALEKARIRRMRGEEFEELDREERGSDDEDGAEGEKLAKMLEMADKDADDDDDSSDADQNDDEEESDGVDGDDDGESGEEGEGTEDEDEEEEDAEGSDSDGSSGEEEELTPEQAEKLKEKLKAVVKKASGRDKEKPVEMVPVRTKVERAKAQVQTVLSRAAEVGINPEMPYTLECPTTMEAFVDMLREHARSAADVRELITRIRKYHTLRSGGDREKVHNLYDLLMRRLVRLGDHMGSPDAGERPWEAEIDALTEALVAMTPEMPTVASALWGRKLTSLQARLGKQLRDYELGVTKSTWPSNGALLLLRLLPQVFPSTDFRHPVVTPALLLMGQALSQCPVTSTRDLISGLFVCGLMLEYTLPAGRLVPEVNAWLLSVLQAMGTSRHGTTAATYTSTKPASHAADGSSNSGVANGHQHRKGKKGKIAGGDDVSATSAASPSLVLPTFASSFAQSLGAATHNLLTTKLASLSSAEAEKVLGPLPLSSADPPEVEEVAGPALRVACHLVKRATMGKKTPLTTHMDSATGGEASKPGAQGPWGKSPAAPEILGPYIKALGCVGGGVGGVLEAVEAAYKAAQDTRTPLQWRKKDPLVVKSVAPKMINGYVVRKDEGMDRNTAKTRQLQRQVKREKKGAMRELRRDAAFLDAEKVRAEREHETERKQAVKANMAWLQEQQATINQQVKKTKGDALRGGGSGVKRSIMGR